MSDQTNVEAKLSELTVSVRTIGDDLDKFARNTNDSIGRLADVVRAQGEHHQSEISDIWEDRRNSLKPNWGWMISAVSLFLFIGGMAVTVLQLGINRIERHQEAVFADYVEHVRDGHPYRIEQRIDHLNKNISLQIQYQADRLDRLQKRKDIKALKLGE